jgi:hypothetical protein
MEDVSLLMAFRSILRPFNIFHGHRVYFVVIWYIFLRVGKLYQDKSGNPGENTNQGMK